MPKSKNNNRLELFWLLKEKYKDFVIGKGRNNAEKLKKDIKRLKKGEPVDYIIGFVDFLGCRIDLRKKPFIPRIETEFWTQKVINILLLENKKHIRCLDMFAGSGCIGISILKHIRNSRVDFVDNNREFLEQAGINLDINKISRRRYRLIQSDVFENITGSYDFIFANPPYIPESGVGDVQKSVLQFEQASALFGGEDGLFYIKRFLKEAKSYLSSGGRIYLEFSPSQKGEIARILDKLHYSNYCFFKDLYQRWRLVEIYGSS
ncbi:peptide chain release factor N(5)-glutamine methyltransferase [bacterium]|nr:peptide chain release factor N(5)-glutamine methyltransferase [bacterium]